MFRKKCQQGNVLIIVLFVIVVMGYLAASLIRISWSNQSGLTREFLGTKAWFVAQSANEWALTKLYPTGGTSKSVSTLCYDVVLGTSPDIAKTAGCEIKPMTCAFIGEFNSSASDAVALFKVQAKATCGSGLSQVQRKQEVWGRD